MCRVEGCGNQSRKGGVCVKHGAGKRECDRDGCKNRAVQGGVCWSHGAKELAGKPTPSKNNEGKVNTAVVTLPLPSLIVNTNVGEKSSRAEAVLTGHGKEVGAALTRKRRQCTHEGCMRWPQLKGLCKSHGESSSKNKRGPYVLKSDFEKDLLQQVAERGVAAKEANGGRLPYGWLGSAIKKLKSNPGCENVNISEYDLSVKVKKMVGGPYALKSDLEKDLLHRAAERGVAAKDANGGLVPRGWFRAEIKKMKGTPGCESVNITSFDLQSKVKSLIHVPKKAAEAPQTAKEPAREVDPVLLQQQQELQQKLQHQQHQEKLQQLQQLWTLQQQLQDLEQLE